MPAVSAFYIKAATVAAGAFVPTYGEMGASPMYGTPGMAAMGMGGAPTSASFAPAPPVSDKSDYEMVVAYLNNECGVKAKIMETETRRY